jgi:DNA-binding SARP family transcriptional activator/basic membrane lipoprotein Med (substrate-binding protein (PBP1-ABC) superfamily)
MRNVLSMPPTLEIGLYFEAKSRQRTEQEARLKVFLVGRIAVEAESVVIDERHFPGRQGRLLFAYLVAQYGRPVPRDELADVVWGDEPPATWDKALSVRVSKLRRVLAECGVDGASALTAAFGCYQLDLPEGTWVDVLAAESAAKEAEAFLETEEFESAVAAAALAESLTRSPFLPGDDGPWVEEKRRELADVRVRALSALAEASLRTDKPAEAVRWAGLAVEAEPFRESGYRRLMEAHVAAGNRGEALRVYERCRRLLADELGAYPSPETESIYRSLLGAPSGRAAGGISEAMSPSGTAPPSPSRRKRPALATTALVVLVVLVAAGTAIAVGATGGGGSGTSSAAPPRVALVAPQVPAVSDDPFASYVDAIQTADGIRAHTFRIPLGKPGLPSRVRRSIGKFDLVLLAGQFVSARFTHEFARHPHTKFVVIDPDPRKGQLFHAVSNSPNGNASDLFFLEGPGAYLAGYLSALMAEKSPGKQRPAVSMVGSYPHVDENAINEFKSGARAAVHGIKVFTRESKSLDPAVCEKIANDQIDSGSRVVYADAAACSPGAIEALEARGFWGIASDQDPSNPIVSPWILGSTTKSFGQAVDYAIQSYRAHTLPPGGHYDIPYERGATADFKPTNPAIPKWMLGRLERVKGQQLKTWEKWGGLN